MRTKLALKDSQHFFGGRCGNFLKKMNFQGEKRNTYVYMAGKFCYVKNKQCNDIIYLKRKNFQCVMAQPKSMCQMKFWNLWELIHVVVEQNTLVISLPWRQWEAATTQQPLHQIYNNIIQTCPDVVKRTLTYLKCEQILQNARPNNCSKNPESLNDAVHLITQSIPFPLSFMTSLVLRSN